jgi:hypothetical protein
VGKFREAKPSLVPVTGTILSASPLQGQHTTKRIPIIEPLIESRRKLERHHLTSFESSRVLSPSKNPFFFNPDFQWAACFKSSMTWLVFGSRWLPEHPQPQAWFQKLHVDGQHHWCQVLPVGKQGIITPSPCMEYFHSHWHALPSVPQAGWNRLVSNHTYKDHILTDIHGLKPTHTHT